MSSNHDPDKLAQLLPQYAFSCKTSGQGLERPSTYTMNCNDSTQATAVIVRRRRARSLPLFATLLLLESARSLLQLESLGRGVEGVKKQSLSPMQRLLCCQAAEEELRGKGELCHLTVFSHRRTGVVSAPWQLKPQSNGSRRPMLSSEWKLRKLHGATSCG